MLFFRVCNYAAKLRIKSKTTKNNVISPAGASLQLVPNSEFTILSPSYLSHSFYLSHLSHLSHPFSQFKIQNSKFSPCPTIAGAARPPSPLSLLIPPTNPILPTRLTSPTCPTRPTIHNSKFIIPLALFRALYRLKKRLSL